MWTRTRSFFISWRSAGQEVAQIGGAFTIDKLDDGQEITASVSRCVLLNVAPRFEQCE
jgi:hypothetical protein